MAEYYNPKNFALTAGAEIDPRERIPRIFSYYAEDDVPEDIIDLSAPFPYPGQYAFFGYWTDDFAPKPPDIKGLPTTANSMCPGSGIMVYGPHQDVVGTPGYDKYWILYLRVTSRWKGPVETTTVLYYPQP